MSSQGQKRKTNANQDEAQQKPKTGRFDELRIYSRSPEREIGREVLRNRDDLKPAMERLLARDPSVTDFVIYYVPSARTLNKIPTAASEQAPLISELEKYLTAELSHQLSQRGVTKPASNSYDDIASSLPDEALPTVCAAMDSAIFQLAVEQGPIILLVPDILQRVNDWTLEGDNGARCWKRLGKYFAQFALVPLGKKGSLAGWWARSRSGLIQEIKELQQSLQTRFQERNDIPADWVLLDAARDTVEGDPGTFLKLGQIEAPIQLFVSAQPESLRKLLAGRSVAGHLSPMDFTDELIGWITNYDPDSVRQVIYRLLR
jgi:hypothetical protein